MRVRLRPPRTAVELPTCVAACSQVCRFPMLYNHTDDAPRIFEAQLPPESLAKREPVTFFSPPRSTRSPLRSRTLKKRAANPSGSHLVPADKNSLFIMCRMRTIPNVIGHWSSPRVVVNLAGIAGFVTDSGMADKEITEEQVRLRQRRCEVGGVCSTAPTIALPYSVSAGLLMKVLCARNEGREGAGDIP